MKFRKKPVVIEAIQFDGSKENFREMKRVFRKKFKDCVYFADSGNMYISTWEGKMLVDIGDWVIKDTDGWLYPCKKDIFEMTYEKVEE